MWWYLVAGAGLYFLTRKDNKKEFIFAVDKVMEEIKKFYTTGVLDKAYVRKLAGQADKLHDELNKESPAKAREASDEVRRKHGDVEAKIKKVFEDWAYTQRAKPVRSVADAGEMIDIQQFATTRSTHVVR